ncbi:protein phosphatase Slingshot homolog 2-like isoform X2 [Brienomyrus brachyistius]|uniref:protein phosphatase Slingshot homolog 2-like isoform X2 n=1 Tax=Brienomyrus brachyistius TaxID=42636 RepID=UPI0020B340DC|nr:protein phosphatase Slingshot homolog 2-like isoform X2 [Brienomyrus brachyistius]
MALVTVQRSPTPSATSSPAVSEVDSGEEDRRSQPRSISESFLTVKGAALFLPRGNGSSPSSVSRITQRWNKHAGDLQQHLQTMFTLLRPEDSIRLAVRLESSHPQWTRYMVVVSTNGRQDTEESVVLGIDFRSSDSLCTIGLVLPLWSDTLIHLDGDGGFTVSSVNRVHIFKPVSVQAMWSALQSLHKACEVARCNNYYPGSLFLTWLSYYQSRVASEQVCINEWNAMQDLQSHRADSPVLFTDVPTERERTERLIKMRLREIMMQKDLENVTSKEIRTELEIQMVCNLREFKEFIDNEMIVILGQMDSPTEIFDHVYLGSEWNASNLEELQNSGVRYILNVTREIDNFFPGLFEYHNIRVYDEEATNLLEYWNDTYKFISKAKKAGAKCLVHCKMGVSRSVSTVIAYAMKEHGWDLERAFHHVKERRAVAKPNPSFMRQLEEYQGILLASKQRHNQLWRSHSDSDVSATPQRPRRLLSNNTNNNAVPSLRHFLGMAVLKALAGEAAEAVALAGESEPPVTGSSSGAPASSSESNSPGGSVETPSSPSLAWQKDPLWLPPASPQAANIAPEDGTGGSSPTPNPVLPLSVPAVEPKLETSELQMAAVSRSQPSTYVPEQNSEPLPAFEPEPAVSETSAIRPSELAIPRSKGEQNGSPSSAGTPMAVSPLGSSGGSLLLGPQISDDNNNPSDTGLTNVPGSSHLSTDSIDFFSAREKFLSLSQDSQACLLAEQASPRTAHAKSPSQDMQPLLEDLNGMPGPEKQGTPEDDREFASEISSAPSRPKKEDGVSVRHIVTELESVSYTVSPVSQLGPRGPPQGEEPEVSGCQSPSSHPDSPSLQPPDWLSGSVRRATKQLEQKLKQELHPSGPCLPTSPTAMGGGSVPVPQEKGCENGASVCQRAGISDLYASHQPNVTADGLLGSEPLQLTVRLAGATEQETNADGELEETPWQGDRLTCSIQDLKKIQETLRELQAFLHEAGGSGGVAKARPEVPDGGEAEPCTDTIQQRAVELEARIRQAGLTPPSLMKRSASLAKLDRLELSTNDLSDWDLCSPPAPPSPSQPQLAPALHPCLHPTPDDASKKQCVLPLWPPEPNSNPVVSLRTEGSQNPDPDPDSPYSPPNRERDGAQDACVAVRLPHGRTHPLWRPRRAIDKKRAAVFVYNTM